MLEDTTVHEYPYIDSQILGVLVQGDVVAVATGEVRVIPGIARIVGRPHRTAESLDRAENVEILDYIGEGYSRVRQGNATHRVKIARTKQRCLENPSPITAGSKYSKNLIVTGGFSLTRLSGAVG